MFGFGVAGNFTGHLEQAGEDSDFLEISTKDNKAPKGIFPYYLEGLDNSFLNVNPLSSEILKLPEDKRRERVQAEPEVVLKVELDYSEERVKGILIKGFGVFNDASTRVDKEKISMKKNWGENSQGISKEFIRIESINPVSRIFDYNLVSFLKRSGELMQYGEDSRIQDYSYFSQELLDWTIDKMNNQKDQGPLENIYNYLKQMNFSKSGYLSIGATRYTDYGAETFLEEGDEIIVITYDRNRFTLEKISQLIMLDELDKEGIVYLNQKVIA